MTTAAIIPLLVALSACTPGTIGAPTTGETRNIDVAGIGIADGPDGSDGAIAAVVPGTPGKVATAEEGVGHADNARVPKGSTWTQHYFPSSDGSDVELHADVLLPEGLEEGERVPVILSVGSYFGHSGETTVEGFEHTGPSTRFGDLVEGTDLFSRGYALVQVDLRGFGGSSGCLDFMGDGEQADVKAAIDWVASQAWSTGSVGMYGKSYDAMTGLVGNNLNHDALKAVIAQAPIWDLSRNMRSNGVPRSPIVDTSRSYNDIATLPQMPDDDARYLANASYEKDNPLCTAENSMNYRTADPDTEYWRTRDLAAQATGTDTPLFITQGFLEFIAHPEAIDEFLINHDGPERGWLGQWDHKRGNEIATDGRLETGREGWFEETMAFYDQYLKGTEPSVKYPAFAIQDSTGGWRAEDTWPSSGTAMIVPIDGGSYLDNGAEGDPAVPTDNSFMQWSEPVEDTTRITGTPSVFFKAAGHGNFMIKLHDVAPDGTAVMFNEQVSMLTTGETDIELKSTDWTLARGHRLAIQVGTLETGNFSNWIKTPSNELIDITSMRLSLTLENPLTDTGLPGEPSVFMETYAPLSTTRQTPQPASFTLPAPPG